jgi:hypothetical protein
LHRLKQATFFTRDEDFFNRGLCHAGYALAGLDAAPAEAAMFIRRFPRHPTQAPFKESFRPYLSAIRISHQNGCSTMDRFGGSPPNKEATACTSQQPVKARPTISAMTIGKRSQEHDFSGASNRWSNGAMANPTAEPCTVNT